MTTSHGLLLVNKDSGLTSHDVVARVRRLLNTREVGHSGTLDPLADGLMVLLIGEATKISNYILEKDKSYRVVAQLGVRTDSLDLTGEVTERSEVRPSLAEVRRALPALTGEFQWAVPLYSAVKVKGTRLHEVARRGESVETPKRSMKFWDVQLHSYDEEKRLVDITLSCSKGSYIRTWVDQLGQTLGCGAAIARLTRTSTPPFDLSQARTLKELETVLASSEEDYLIPLHQALPQMQSIRVKGHDEYLVGHGQISHDLRAQMIARVSSTFDDTFQIKGDSGRLLALIALEKEKGFCIRRVFKYEG